MLHFETKQNAIGKKKKKEKRRRGKRFFFNFTMKAVLISSQIIRLKIRLIKFIFISLKMDKIIYTHLSKALRVLLLRSIAQAKCSNIRLFSSQINLKI